MENYFLLVLLPALILSLDCPDSDETAGEKCYELLGTNNGSAALAYHVCKANNGSLAEPKTREEAESLKKDFGDGYNFWVGVSQEKDSGK